VLPRSRADAPDRAVFLDTLAWADRALAEIGRLASPAYLKALKKKTLRELSQAENRAFEEYKFYALCQVEPYADLSAKTLADLSGKALTVPAAVDELLKTTVAKHRESRGEDPTVEDLRKYRAGVYALWRGDYPEGPAA
jgi:thiamine biosynthesis lipoprotein ApbE